MKTKKQIINRVLLSIPVLREKIVQRLKDNRNLAANAAISCAEKRIGTIMKIMLNVLCIIKMLF